MNHICFTIRFLFLIIIIGCTGQNVPEIPEHLRELKNLTVYPVDDEPPYRIDLIKDQIFEDSEEVTFASMTFMDIDDQDHVFIGDMRENRVNIFRPDGSFLTHIGRTGEGPGEAGQTGRIFIQSDRLYVYDISGRRVNIFTISGLPENAPDYVRTVRLSDENWDRDAEEQDLGLGLSGLVDVRTDGSLLLLARTSPFIYRENSQAQGTRRYYLMGSNETTISEAIFQQNEPEHIVTEWFIVPPPFASRGLTEFSGDGRIFSAWTDEFLIRIHDSKGNYLRSFYRPVDGVSLNLEDAIASVDDHEQLHQAVRSMSLPDRWPVLDRVLVDDENRLWVATIVEEQEVHEWWVLQETGELVTRFTWPRNRRIQTVKNGHLYTRERDEMGLQTIVKYRIDLEAV